MGWTVQEHSLRSIGSGATAAALVNEITWAARAQVNVLITGESGLGKRLIARLIHKQSNRGGRLVALDCRGVSNDLVERELFGDPSHAGLLRFARHGTLLLSNVHYLSVWNQTRLERFLASPEPGNKDLRIVSTTTEDLLPAIETGRFREDLFYRFNSIHLHLAPLRTRLAEIPMLTRHLLTSLATTYHVSASDITGKALDALMSYTWPGNVRQLRRVLTQALRHAATAAIDLSDFPGEIAMRERTFNLAEPEGLVLSLP